MSVKSPPTVYVPCDSGARAVGADAVAAALLREASQHGIELKLKRNSARGMFWLEPLVEVDHDGQRLGYGPVEVADIPALFAAGFLHGGPHPLGLGPLVQHPYLSRQTRLTCARLGWTEPLSLGDYEAHGGWVGLRRALTLSAEQIVQEVVDAGLRGRGGAGFPAGIKWRTVAQAPGTSKYIVVNADEGDSGTFADRMILEGDPYLLLEGMIIAGLAVGATQGYVYVRSEYPDGFEMMRAAVGRARPLGLLGDNVLGSGHRFEVIVRKGAGSYVCGEETALLESLEGRRGIVRSKPPLPALSGLFGQPTVINNVLTLAAVPLILSQGAQAYAAHGMGRSRGTLPFQLAGNVRQGGLVELPFGHTLRELIEVFGGGTASGRPLRAVQVGGPLGAYLTSEQLDLPLDYEALLANGGTLGHGGVVIFDDSVDLLEQARHALAFCAQESCGKCTPCRIGSTRGVEILDRLRQNPDTASRQIELLRDLCHTMLHGSLCAMGGMTPYPVLSALDRFSADFSQPKGAHPALPLEADG